MIVHTGWTIKRKVFLLINDFILFALTRTAKLLDGRRKKTTQISEKSIVVLYNKISELINSLAELLSIQVLTDTSVLHASSMGVSPFFVENVSELQLACLKLVTTVTN